LGLVQKGFDVCPVKKQVVAIYQTGFICVREGVIRRELNFSFGKREQDIPLQQPERFVIDPQIAGGFIKWQNMSGILEDDFNHGFADAAG
jgi:hypothetical protein